MSAWLIGKKLSVHFRGPIVLRQFAAYQPRGLKRVVLEKKAVRDWVTATIDGQVVSWVNIYDGKPATTAGEPMVTATIDGQVVSWVNDYDPAAGLPVPTSSSVPFDPATTSTASTTQAATTIDGQEGPWFGNSGAAASDLGESIDKPDTTSHSTVISSSRHAATTKLAAKPTSTRQSPKPLQSTVNNWVRTAYYDMTNQTAEGVTFLNNMGGQGSGVWDKFFGNSLSYASADAQSGSATAQIFDGSLQSQQEIAIFSDTSCKNVNCGFVRPGSVDYCRSSHVFSMHLLMWSDGFASSQKAFFFEFEMPLDDTSGADTDMPAIWFLNAQIPRTEQYGSCSCWASGCGELDVFETLDSGDTRYIFPSVQTCPYSLC